MHSAFRREDRSLLSAMVALALSSYKFLSNLERRKRKKRESHSYNIYQKVAPDFLFANLNQHTSSSSSPKRLQKSVTVCVDLALSFEKGELAIWLTNDSPTLNYVGVETFSTSALNFAPAGVKATSIQLSICYCNQDLHWPLLHLKLPCRLLCKLATSLYTLLFVTDVFQYNSGSR